MRPRRQKNRDDACFLSNHPFGFLLSSWKVILLSEGDSNVPNRSDLCEVMRFRDRPAERPLILGGAIRLLA